MTTATNGNHEKTTDRLAKAAHQGIDRASAELGDAEDRVREGVTRAAEKLQDGVSSLKAQALPAYKQLGDYCGKHPVAALSIAFGAGIIAGAVLRR